MIPIYDIIFYFFALLLIGCAFMMIVARNPVRALLFMVLCFFCSAVLWMMLQAEFLSLMLIFVYVGAVMTLFLFVVMMINIDFVTVREHFVRYLPFAIIIVALLVGTMIIVLHPWGQPGFTESPIHHPAGYSDTQTLGALLYTHYLYPFELAGVVLFTAIIAAISLAFFGRKHDSKRQNIAAQHRATKKSRLRIIDMKGGDHGNAQ